MPLVVIFDLESTGLSTCNDRITQIGAVLTAYDQEDKPIDGSFETLVYTDREISDKVSSITGITRAKLQGAPTTKEAISKFFTWIQGLRRSSEEVSMVAYNGHQFDFPLLFNEMERCGLNVVQLMQSAGVVWFVDPLKWARESLDTSKLRRKNTGACSYCLGDVYSAMFGASIEQAHTALADAVALQRLLNDDSFVGLEIGKSSRYCVSLELFVSDLLKIKHNRAKSSKSTRKGGGVSSLADLANKKRPRSESLVSSQLSAAAQDK